MQAGQRPLREQERCDQGSPLPACPLTAYAEQPVTAYTNFILNW